MSGLDARDLRLALKLVAGELNANPEYRRLSARENIGSAMAALDKELVGAQGGDFLTETCARLLLALERRERDRLADQPQFPRYSNDQPRRQRT